MHLSNYNLFSFLVPEKEVLGNQTYCSHWNPVSSGFRSCPLPVYLEELGLYVDIPAILRWCWCSVPFTPTPHQKGLHWFCYYVFDPFLSIENLEVQLLGSLEQGTPIISPWE